MSRCRSCNAPIRWALTEKGKRIPLDSEAVEPIDPRGLFVLRNVFGAGPTAIAATPESFPGEPLYRAHFVTCDHPERFRKRRTR